VTGILAVARVRRVLLLVGLAFAVLPAGSALADTTIGQIGPPFDKALEGHIDVIQTSAAMPAAGLITSFSTHSGTCISPRIQGIYDVQVLRPLGGNDYEVVGDTGSQTDPCEGNVHSYSVSIPVQAGDVIGAYVVRPWQGILTIGTGSLSIALGIGSQPDVGDQVMAAID
jgi:hypothetical protein